MSAQHTPGRLKAVACDLMQDGGRLRMASNVTACGAGGGLQENVDAALSNASRLAACWNACDGFDTDMLTLIATMGDTLKQRFEGMQAEVRRVDALLAERDQRIADLERHGKTMSQIMNDLLVGNQAAWIEWQHGKGAEEAMVWVEGSLAGVGVPDEDEPWAREAQAWYSANKADPFPTCFCGRPSNHLWMGQGFCSDAHYDQGRAKATAEAAGATGLPLFDGKVAPTGGAA